MNAGDVTISSLQFCFGASLIVIEFCQQVRNSKVMEMLPQMNLVMEEVHMFRQLAISSIVLTGIIVFGAVKTSAKTVNVVCSITAAAHQNHPSEIVTWQLPAAPMGIFNPNAYRFYIDLDKKKISFPPDAVPPGGPFQITIYDTIFEISSVPDPKVATGRVTFGIDRRTGAFIMRSDEILMQNGQLNVVGTDWQTGTCGTDKTIF